MKKMEYVEYILMAVVATVIGFCAGYKTRKYIDMKDVYIPEQSQLIEL